MKRFAVILAFAVVTLSSHGESAWNDNPLGLIAGFAYATERGRAGLELEFQIHGRLSPRIERAIVVNVEADSAAEMAGVVKGQLVLEIGEDCSIPGCKASAARRAMNKSRGETLILVLQKKNGEKYTAELVLQ